MTLERYAGKGMPVGWYQIAWSAQIAPGEVKPLRYFGQELVLVRSESGVVSLYDAYCPHMGAHLGYGGCVKGENLACPYHGWEFDIAGAVAAIPYTQKLNRSRSLRRWHTEEPGGQMILAWWHPDGADPYIPIPDVPELGDESFYPAYPCANHYPNLAMHPEWIPENTVDMAHFQFVHETPDVATMVDLKLDGPLLAVQFTMPMKHFTDRTERGSGTTSIVQALAEVTCYGMGLMVTRFEVDKSILYQSHTPVDEELTDIFFTVLVPRPPGNTDPEPSGGGKARIGMLFRQVENDMLIWTHRRMEPNPALTIEEARPFKQFGIWKKQFYPAVPVEVT